VAAPCWQKLLSDSYDGHVDARYPASCFHQAIAHIPPVVEVYTSTRDELARALRLQLTGHGPVPRVVARAAGGGVPLPLLALGSLAVLLILAGLVPAVRRRLQTLRGR
jgi:hypothetical protein